MQDDFDKCSGCPLREGRYVPATGPADCPFFVVGSAPGQEETQTGKGFTGPAGVLLRDLLSALGLEVVLTNVLKRAPKDKKPSKSECFRCGLHLIEELKNHKAVVVLTLGETPLRFLNGENNLKLDAVHGLPIPINRFGMRLIVVPTWSPSRILASGGIDTTLGDEWLYDLEEYRDTVRRNG